MTDDRLIRCDRGHLDWYDEHGCDIMERDGVAACWLEMPARHQPAWRCARCKGEQQPVRRRSARADALEAICWPST